MKKTTNFVSNPMRSGIRLPLQYPRTQDFLIGNLLLVCQ